jgi:cyclophilin family peptidyl-prolyl cis-trans isomerase
LSSYLKKSLLVLSVLMAIAIAVTACSTVAPGSPAPTDTAVPAAVPTDTAAPPTEPAAAAVAAPAGSQPVLPIGSERPLADLPREQRVNMFQAPPDLQIDPNKIYLATIATDKGDIVVEMYSQEAPIGANNFIVLASLGYFDGITMTVDASGPAILGGDPLGTGEGGPGYEVPAELGLPNLKGAMGYLRVPDQFNPDRVSSGSQFYMALNDFPELDGVYAVFGQIVEGLDVAEQVATGDLIQQITISEADERRSPTPPPPTPTPEPVTPALDPSGVRLLADMPPEERADLFNTPPAMQLEPGKDYQARIATDKGDIVVDLFEEQAPNTVNNFVVLAGLGFYDNTTFHRVIENFMAQAGDPTATGAGGPGYRFADEFSPELRHDSEGVLSMANAGRNTNGSQFFITFEPTPWLDDMHTVFGKVIEGMDVVKSISLRDPDTATTPGDLIKSITIETK